MTKKKVSATDRAPRPQQKPRTRADGELYKRPEPNPFTSEWLAGYADGMDGLGYNPLAAGGNPQNYRDGYETAKSEADTLDRLGSSNA